MKAIIDVNNVQLQISKLSVSYHPTHHQNHYGY
ncbi:hypothetical protein 65p279 [Aeromonas phage 65]|uniref:Uncharacterized protein n=1 Tax=Aeromonas phage 65 TaxID=2919549 RepID=E5DSB3_9CAUD|nr:hypothetical protein ST65p279 [Aeromonas phage 65]ADQ53287.1 hypothetical protein 65p279 [Aeromonas phage 65]